MENYPEDVKPERQAKYVDIADAIGKLDRIPDQLRRLLERINEGPTQESPGSTTSTGFPTLRAILDDGGKVINNRCDDAFNLIDEIEKSLF